MSPIYLIYDSRVGETEKKIVIKTLSKAAKVFGGRRFYNLGLNPRLNGKERVSAETIISKAARIRIGNYGPQYDANDIFEQINNSKRQRKRPSTIVFVTSRDLTVNLGEGYLNFCFGYALEKIAIVSVARTRDLSGKEKELMIKALVMHELGHAFGLAKGIRSNTENNLGKHCTNPGCIMNQALSRRDLIKISKWISKRKAPYEKACYCPQCREQAHLSF